MQEFFVNLQQIIGYREFLLGNLVVGLPDSGSGRHCYILDFYLPSHNNNI